MRYDVIYTYGDLAAVREACRLAKNQKRVLIAVPETCLAGEIWNTLNCSGACLEELEPWLPASMKSMKNLRVMPPDETKRQLEDLCETYGVDLLYGVSMLNAEKSAETGAVWELSFAHKGGVYRAECSDFYTKKQSSMQLSDRFSYAAWISAEDKIPLELEGKNFQLSLEQRIGILRVFADAAEIVDAAGQMDTEDTGMEAFHSRLTCFLMERLLSVYESLKEQMPTLLLGRFAAEIATESQAPVFQKNAVPDRKPIRRQYDLAVIGGGTAGVMAAIAAARQGIRVGLAEKEALLGGTQTIGGVSTYWFGCRYREVREMDQKVAAVMDRLGLPRRKGIWSGTDDSHTGIKSYIYLKECLEAGVDLLFGQTVYTARMDEQNRLREVECAGNGVGYQLEAEAFLDATGDADVCVFAQAGYTYGSEEDHITFWASLAQYTGTNTYRNNFSSMTDCSDPEDMTRFIRLGRKRGSGLFDHGSMVSMRESRHIKGITCISLKDVVKGKTYPDVLYTGYSNYDPKGRLDADMVYAGVLPPQVRMQVPLSALLPCRPDGTRIEHLYAAGKAVSATHNGFPALRMQPDLMHQGYVLGSLIAKAQKERTWPELLSQEIRVKWIHEVTDDPLTLSYCSMDPEEAVSRLSEKSRTQWVDFPFEKEETLPSEVISMMTADSEMVLPYLLAKTDRETKPYEWNRETDGIPYRIRLIGWCLWHGCDRDSKEYCEFLLKTLKASSLMPRHGSTVCANLLPDHGVMPELVYQINLLAWTGSDAVYPVLRELTSQLLLAKRDYTDIHAGIYPYMESIAYVAEHRGGRELIPLLKELLSAEEFAKARKEQAQTELLAERLQILQMRLFTALHRLSDPDGESGLRQMTEDPILSRPVRDSARMLLAQKGILIRRKKW